jgi:hypothetical protein
MINRDTSFLDLKYLEGRVRDGRDPVQLVGLCATEVKRDQKRRMKNQFVLL